MNINRYPLIVTNEKMKRQNSYDYRDFVRDENDNLVHKSKLNQKVSVK